MADEPTRAGSNVAKSLEERLKLVGVVLGLASTALGVYVAVKTQWIAAATGEIDTQVKATQAETARINKQLAEQDLNRKKWESSVRLVAQWHVMNANEFAQGQDNPGSNLAWVDDGLQTQLTTAASAWKGHAHLMARLSNDALLLRQVICLRLLNIGSSPAKRLRLLAHVREFQAASGGQGGVGGLYSELRQRGAAEPAHEFKLGDLMEAGQEQRHLLTEMVIPVAHAVGSQRYVGRVLVPVKLLWFDERQGKEDSLDIEIDDPVLARRLQSADLGITSK
jgi:hypothetical protein